jgi:peptidoglycan endopeptidase LytE
VITSPFALVYEITAEDITAFSSLRRADIVTVVSIHEQYLGIIYDDEIAFIEWATVVIPYFVELPTARIGSSLASLIIEMSFSYLGTPYLWGGASPAGFDCSGFMVYLFASQGIRLYHSSVIQAQRHGFRVTRNEIERGDLVFFGSDGEISHVGLYTGDGHFIHASSGGGVVISVVDEQYGFITARRVIF